MRTPKRRNFIRRGDDRKINLLLFEELATLGMTGQVQKDGIPRYARNDGQVQKDEIPRYARNDGQVQKDGVPRYARNDGQVQG